MAKATASVLLRDPVMGSDAHCTVSVKNNLALGWKQPLTVGTEMSVAVLK